MSASIKLARAIALGLGGVTVTFSALGGQLDYTLYGGIEHSDNIALTSTDPTSQNVLIPGLSFAYLQQGQDLQANMAGNLEYRDYLGSRFTDQTQLQLASQANWTILPARLDLAIQDYAGVQPIDRLASNAPDNQQQTNVFTFGPTFHFGIGESTRGQAQLRYINSYAQKTKGFNSHRTRASLGIIKDVSPTDQLSANWEAQRVYLTEQAATPDYDRNELFGRYVSKLSHLNLDLALGWAQLDFHRAGTPTASGPLARLTLDYTPTERTTLSLAAAREYSDAAQDLMLLQPTGILEGTGRGIDVGNTTVDSQVYLERRLRLTYAFRTERLGVSVAPLYRKLGYVNDPSQDQTTRGATIDIDYRLRPTLTLSVVAAGERLDYDRLARRDTTINYGLDLVGQRNRHWGWRASLLRQQRHSDQPGQSYHENQIYFGIIYSR
jgi:Putative beta-barrel porin 2